MFVTEKMVRTYKKTSNQHLWSSEFMKKAVKSVVLGEKGYKKASQTTLERYVLQHRNNPDNTLLKKRLGHYTTVFSPNKRRNASLYKDNGSEVSWSYHP